MSGIKDLRISHIWALHAMQGIPLLIWIGAKCGITQSSFVWGIFLIWNAITGFLFLKAVQGLPFL
jgi:hypothetical protein